MIKTQEAIATCISSINELESVRQSGIQLTQIGQRALENLQLILKALVEIDRQQSERFDRLNVGFDGELQNDYTLYLLGKILSAREGGQPEVMEALSFALIAYLRLLVKVPDPTGTFDRMLHIAHTKSNFAKEVRNV